MFWLILAAYVVLGIGTARAAYSAEYMYFAKQLSGKRTDQRAPSRRDVHREMEPVGLYPVMAGTLWPIALIVGMGWMVGRAFGPLIGKWWYASINRKLRKAGLS